METSEIYSVLKTQTDLEYLLCNTYIFAWESDIFGISKKGYTYEIEVKSSRADFNADFSKLNKHKILKSAYNGKEIATLRTGMKYEYEVIPRHSPAPIKRTVITSDMKPIKSFENTKEICSNISFIKIFSPHRFYYATPKGMVQKHEVPQYAGLYWIDETNKLITKKRAPLLHKIKIDFTSKLLHKFYHKSLQLEYKYQELSMQYKFLAQKGMNGDLAGDLKVEEMTIQTMLDLTK